MITPPTVGPSTPAIPNMLEIRAVPNGLFLRGTDVPNIAKLPHSNPAAPTPAIALPIINDIEFRAAAHTTEPTSTKYR